MKKTIIITAALALATPAAALSAIETPTTLAAQDVKSLKDGVYEVSGVIMNFNDPSKASMANEAINKNIKLIVENGKYYVEVSFGPIVKKFGANNFRGYLGNLSAKNSSVSIVSYYGANEKDDFFNVYTNKFPNRTAYPKTFKISVDKNSVASNKLTQQITVFVPVMESISPGAGTQNANLVLDFSNIKTISVKQTQEPSQSESGSGSTGQSQDNNTGQSQDNNGGQSQDNNGGQSQNNNDGQSQNNNDGQSQNNNDGQSQNTEAGTTGSNQDGTNMMNNNQISNKGGIKMTPVNGTGQMQTSKKTLSKTGIATTSAVALALLAMAGAILLRKTQK